MKYIISDLHGCYDEYMELIKKINLKDSDDLYILGDVVDRGPHPIKILQDMMLRPNVFPIIGNHDFMALVLLKKLSVEVTADNIEDYLTEEDMSNFMSWMKEGGDTTVNEFTSLDIEERGDIIDYLEEFSVYHELDADGKHYILVHAGLNGFEESKDIEEYSLADLLYDRVDYDRRYYSDKNIFLVTGHTPTPVIREDKQPLVYEKNGHIALDCGCVFGGRLAAYCVDTGEITYVDAKKIS